MVKKRTGMIFRDPDRAIRKLSQQGQLIKIAKGVYKYDPDFVKENSRNLRRLKKKKFLREIIIDV